MERDIESYMRVEAEKHGALLLKFVSPMTSGVPDRILLHTALTKPVFIELKDHGKTPRALQIETHKMLRAHGAEVYTIDSKDGAKELLDSLLGPVTKPPKSQAKGGQSSCAYQNWTLR